jgi:ribosomal protein L19
MPAISVTSPKQQREMLELYRQLQPGDRVEVEHTVTVGTRQWTTKREGKVVRKERTREGLHFRRNFDDVVCADTLLLELPDGELTTVTLDEFTTLRRAP